MTSPHRHCLEPGHRHTTTVPTCVGSAEHSVLRRRGRRRRGGGTPTEPPRGSSARWTELLEVRALDISTSSSTATFTRTNCSRSTGSSPASWTGKRPASTTRSGTSTSGNGVRGCGVAIASTCLASGPSCGGRTHANVALPLIRDRWRPPSGFARRSTCSTTKVGPRFSGPSTNNSKRSDQALSYGVARVRTLGSWRNASRSRSTAKTLTGSPSSGPRYLATNRRTHPTVTEAGPSTARAQGEEPGEAWIKIADPNDRGPTILFHRVPEAKVVKNRVHLDIRAPDDGPDDRRQQVDAFIERIVGLGGSKIRDVIDDAGYFAVMHDPEGNEFCVG